MSKTTVQASLLARKTHSDNSSAWTFFPVSSRKVSCDYSGYPIQLKTQSPLRNSPLTIRRALYVLNTLTIRRALYVLNTLTLHRALYMLNTLTHVAQNVRTCSPKIQVLIRSS